MTLEEYFATEPIGAKMEMAGYLGITKEWMSKLISRSPKYVCSAALAKRIEEATQGLVTRKELRPDLFA
jgi:DNA-binding transcriptional regulator YdaS (Cro superfamily)